MKKNMYSKNFIWFKGNKCLRVKSFLFQNVQNEIFEIFQVI